MRKLRNSIVMIFILSLIVCVVYIAANIIGGKSEAPVITGDEELIEVSVEDKESVLLQGLKAEDKEDGDLTDDIRVVSMSHFIKGSKRKIKYVVFDSSNQAGVYEREVEYTDYTPPRIYMEEALRYDEKEMSKADFTEHLRAEDCIDGNLTNQIRCIYDTFMYGNDKSYPITLQVSNKAGDVQSVKVDVAITDSTDPEERQKYYPILSDYIVYTREGKELSLRKYIKGLEQNGTEYLYSKDDDLEDRTKSKIKISEDIDYSDPGVYEVEYSYRSGDGVKAVTKAYVVVEEK